MSQISIHTGQQIRLFRKLKGLTLQQLADQIHKSRATISKYENGEISLDIETLAEIAQVLQVSPNQLLDIQPPPPSVPETSGDGISMSPFFQARRLYLYFYDGRYQRLKNGIIDIDQSPNDPVHHQAMLSISSLSATGRSSEMYYTGNVLYSDMLIRFTFQNQYNALERDLLYIFNPLEVRSFTDGLFCGISGADLMPCAFKCLVTLTPQKQTEDLKKQLLFTRQELQRWQKLNMLIVDNRE